MREGGGARLSPSIAPVDQGTSEQIHSFKSPVPLLVYIHTYIYIGTAELPLNNMPACMQGRGDSRQRQGPCAANAAAGPARRPPGLEAVEGRGLVALWQTAPTSSFAVLVLRLHGLAAMLE